jgi:hypothetical protein
MIIHDLANQSFLFIKRMKKKVEKKKKKVK